jgi:lipoyl(octanoyl) transferase
MNSFTYKNLGAIDYSEALDIQTAAFESLLSAKSKGRPMKGTLFFCEHNPVFTIGKSGKDKNMLMSEDFLRSRGISLFHINRGGDITYHGPGQITGYPVFDLERWDLGLKAYIERLETAIIRLLEIYGIKGELLDGATGVWIEPQDPKKARKICAIGVKSSRYVTMHGFALNVNTNLEYFTYINPCGFVDKGVTSMAKELGHELDIEKVKEQLHAILEELFP